MHSGRCKSLPTYRISVFAIPKSQIGFVTFKLKDHPRVHCDLTRIEGPDAERSICRRGAVAGRRAGEHCVAQAAAEVAVVLGVIQHVAGVGGNLQFDALAYCERSSKTQIHVEATRPSKVAISLVGRTEPKLVGDGGPIWSSEHLTLKRARIIFKKGVLGRGHLQAAWQGDRRLSVVPALKLRGHC